MIKIILIVLLLVCVLNIIAQFRSGTRWECAEDIFNASHQKDEIRMALHKGYLYVKTSRTIHINVKEEDGARVSDTHLDAGTYRMPLKSRGIYTVKAGKTVRRVRVE